MQQAAAASRAFLYLSPSFSFFGCSLPFARLNKYFLCYLDINNVFGFPLIRCLDNSG